MRREWTDWEVQYLERFYLRQSVERTAKRLNRTVSSVIHKAQRLKLVRYRTEFCTKL